MEIQIPLLDTVGSVQNGRIVSKSIMNDRKRRSGDCLQSFAGTQHQTWLGTFQGTKQSPSSMLNLMPFGSPLGDAIIVPRSLLSLAPFVDPGVDSCNKPGLVPIEVRVSFVTVGAE